MQWSVYNAVVPQLMAETLPESAPVADRKASLLEYTNFPRYMGHLNDIYFTE